MPSIFVIFYETIMNEQGKPGFRFFRLWAVLVLILAAAGVLYLVMQKSHAPKKDKVESVYMPGFPLYTEDMERMPIELFFPDKNLVLKGENGVIYKSKDPVDRMRQVLVLLLRGPRSDSLLPVFPEGIMLRELYLHDGCVYLDFQVPASKVSPVGCFMEFLAAASIQSSLTKNFPEVEKVKVVLNGMEAETFFGHIDIRSPFPDLKAGG